MILLWNENYSTLSEMMENLGKNKIFIHGKFNMNSVESMESHNDVLLHFTRKQHFQFNSKALTFSLSNKNWIQFSFDFPVYLPPFILTWKCKNNFFFIHTMAEKLGKMELDEMMMMVEMGHVLHKTSVVDKQSIDFKFSLVFFASFSIPFS